MKSQEDLIIVHKLLSQLFVRDPDSVEYEEVKEIAKDLNLLEILLTKVVDLRTLKTLIKADERTALSTYNHFSRYTPEYQLSEAEYDIIKRRLGL